ncbi:hypothetical protein Tco_1422984, partial [Tanacetum coccineum]
DQPMWAADCVVALTLGFVITLPATANEFSIKGPSNTDTERIMARTDAMTMKMDAQYKELQSQSKQSTPDEKDDDIPMSREEEEKFMQTFYAEIFDSGDENEEPTPQPTPQLPKPIKETQIPKPYKPKILYPQRLRKEKMEAQYGKFLDIIHAIRINIPLVDVLAGMPNYGKFLKDLISNKHKIKQFSTAFLSDESSAMIQNKVPPKLGDPGSFLIPYNFNKAFSCNALANLGASINFMPYSFYAKLSLGTLKPTKYEVKICRQIIRIPVGGIAKKIMLVEVDSAIKHSYSNDDTCFSIDEILEEDFDALLDEESQILHLIEGTVLEEKLFAEFDEFIAMTADENPKSETEEEPEFEKITINTYYKIKTSLKEPPTDLKLKPLLDNLEYVFLEDLFFL